MPNWCYTTMIVYGDKTQLNKFANCLREAFALPHATDPELLDSHDVWLGKIWKCSGYSDRYINSRSSVDCRGWIDDVDYDNLNDEEPYITVYYESSWTSRVEEFDHLLSMKYPKLKQVSKVTEDGMGVYYHTDATGKYFHNEYLLDCCFHDEYYYEFYSSKEDLIKGVNNIFGTKLTTYDECMEYEYNFEGDEDDYADDFISIHEYSYSN